MTQTPADWYPDPSNPASTRYWDGTAWTSLTRPAAAAPPAGPPAPAMEAFAPKKSRRGLWITLSLVGVLVLGLGIAAVVFVAGKFTPMSPNYTGAPVYASDEAPAGMTAIISDTATVAAEIPSGWHDFQEYVDLDALVGNPPSGSSLLGAWFTGDPETARAVPQLVMVMEMSPAAAGPGTLGDMRNQYLSGMKISLPTIVVGSSQDYTTELGLDGERTDATFTIAEQGISGTIAVIGVAHGRRFVVVQWTSYDGPIDEESLDGFMAALRVDT